MPVTARRRPAGVDVPRERLAQLGCVVVAQVDLVLGLVERKLHGRVGRITGQVINEYNLGRGSHTAKRSSDDQEVKNGNTMRVRG